MRTLHPPASPPSIPRQHPFLRLIAPGILGVTLVISQAEGRPGGAERPRFRSTRAEGATADLPPASRLAVFSAAQGGTTWFGGTVWAADSLRWEALEGGIWTFESGVGSSFVPPGGVQDLSSPTRDWADPYKQPGLHATLEGWIGFDNKYHNEAYFRRLAHNDIRWEGDVCVGSPAGLGGLYSLWCGVFPSEAAELCYVDGQGYGNNWFTCVTRSFDYDGTGEVTLGFTYRNATEANFDFSLVFVDTSGNDTDVERSSYTGDESGTANLILTPGQHLPVDAGPIRIKFCFESDGAWSDQDGLFTTTCGAFAVDDIAVTGGGIQHVADFENSDDGWELLPPLPGPGGEWANLVHRDDLPPMISECECPLEDSVLVLFNDLNGHGPRQDNLVASPWIDLKASGQDQTSGRIISTQVYAELPVLNYIFFQYAAQWYPSFCQVTGKLVTSPWISSGFIFFFDGVPGCNMRGVSDPTFQVDYSSVIPPAAEQVRIALGLVSHCRFFSNCTGITNTTPWFDNVRFGVYGTPGTPSLSVEDVGLPQDNFPRNGTIHAGALGRVDCNDIQGAGQPEVGTTLGDTLVVRGAIGNAEVHVHFRVTPGPGVNSARFDDWWNPHPDSPYEAGFKTARCDSAEWGGSGPISGYWMTTYHESDPNFTGTDRDLDPQDPPPAGGAWRLNNDIFPDDLFTPGTRLDLFYTANHLGSTAHNRIPPAPHTFEMEILPTTPAGVGGLENCVLYVDHAGGGSQAQIETALYEILGTGSSNYEGTNWDRFDVNAPSSRQMSFGRPQQTEYGASLLQTLAYRVIIWSTGEQNRFNLTQEDAAVLNPWLSQLIPEYNTGYNKLYLTGDGIVYSAVTGAAAEPAVLQLVENLVGATLRTSCAQGNFRLADCPIFGSPADHTPCVALDPVLNAPVAGNGPGRGVDHLAHGNGCPDLRSFDVLDLATPDHGISAADERYSSPLKTVRFVSIANQAELSGPLHYRTVVEGVAVEARRDEEAPCATGQGGSTAVTERMREVLDYFRFPSGDLCTMPITGIGDPVELGPIYRLALAAASPNPLVSGRPAQVRFSLSREGRARVTLYDLQGRLVASLFDAVAPAGDSEVTWHGRDFAGTPVGSGVYVLRLEAEGQERTSRIVVLRGGSR